MSAHDASLSCPVCSHNGVFESVQSLRDRLIQVSTNKLLCPVCQEEVFGLDKLTIHLFSHVKILTTKAKENDKLLIPDGKPSPEKQVITQQKKMKTSVVKNKTPSSTTNAPVKFVKIYPKLPVVSVNTVPVIDISRRTDSAQGETPYACAQCNKTFTFQQSYHKHLLYHNDEKPHTCTYCGRAFKELSTLHNHQRIHTGEKPFSCETCGKCFRQRVSYLVHRRIHTGVMPYKCTACQKSFRYKVSQRTHKCQAQPPGTVVRQAGELVEKLKQKHIEPDAEITDKQVTAIENLTYTDVSEANAELVRTGAKLSLEDMESEHFSIIAENFNEIGECNKSLGSFVQNTSLSNKGDDVIFNQNIEELIDSIPIEDKNIPSPSEILKNLCLSKDDDYIGFLQTSNDEKSYEISKDFNVFL
ncbi:zinc finger protein 665 isoform X2 [Spodoptera litura]|uniref:Zinc finger protein 665 isoform X2 n=1 Tax=Spodoptera litura TaxID=69820 RepID=A0A9J7IQB4_SPOLT|nr:zinc finger protein 665 isoform X2 [Spodoptera litura]